MVQWFLIKKNNFCQCIFTVTLLRVSSLKKRRDPSFEKKKNFLRWRVRCAKFGWYWFSYKRENGRNDDGQQSIRKKFTWSFISVYCNCLLPGSDMLPLNPVNKCIVNKIRENAFSTIWSNCGYMYMTTNCPYTALSKVWQNNTDQN